MSQYGRWPAPSGGGGGGVTSLNGETGAVTLLAGTGITITPFGSGITIAATGGGGSGTVTSVGLVDGSTSPIYSVSGSPVTTSGNLTFTLASQNPNLVFAGPSSGGAAQPTFRSLVAADIPSLSYVNTIGLIDSQTPSSNGLVISGNDLYAQSASNSNPGLVNNTTQIFSGNKTFNGTVFILPSSTTALEVGTNSTFIVDTVNIALGIGIQPSPSVMIDGVNTTGTSKLVQMTGYGAGSTTGYRGRFARGTSGSPTAVNSGDNLNVISGRGYGTTQFAAASTGIMNVVAGETFTDTSNLTYLQFMTTPTGSVTAAESMRIAPTGVTLGPQSASTAAHQVNGSLALTTRTVTASTLTVDTTTTDYQIFTDSTSNAITITLPPATNGRVLFIQDKTGEAATNHITITPPGSVTINGVNASIILGTNYSGYRLVSDGTNWVATVILPFAVPAQAISASSIDWNTGSVFTKTLSANTTFTFANQLSGQTIVVRLTNTASNFTVTWPTVKWTNQTAPTMTIGAFSDVYTFVYDGVNTYGSYVQNF